MLTDDEIFRRKNYKHTFPNGDVVSAVNYRNSKDVTIKFKCGNTKSVYWKDLIDNKVMNPYQLRKDGHTYIGFNLDKNYIIGGLDVYDLWDNMCQRCFSASYKTNHKSYEDCTLSPEWFNFQNFFSWVKENLKSSASVLDKDLLQTGNKHYSPTTCCFIPEEINLALISKRRKESSLPAGVGKDKKTYSARISENGIKRHLGNYPTVDEAFQEYKLNKELYFKSLALKYKDTLPVECFNKLMEREINLDD